jgi:hypothetical protein
VWKVLKKRIKASNSLILQVYFMKYLPIILLFCLPLIFTNCSTTERAPREARTADSSEVDFSQYRNLADYLRRLPGVQVRGTGDNVNIQIRGASSFSSETQPLFVLDGRVMGNNYSEVNRFLSRVKWVVFRFSPIVKPVLTECAVQTG